MVDAAGRNRRPRRQRGEEPAEEAEVPVVPFPTFGGFRPTDEMVYLKAAWYAAAESYLVDMTGIDEADLIMYLPASISGRMLELWRQDAGFRDYVRTAPHIEQAAKIEYAYMKALDAAMSVLMDTDPKSANARVNAIKLIAELGKKITPRNQKSSDDESLSKLIASMDTTQLLATAQAGNKQLKIAVQTGNVSPASVKGPTTQEPQDAEEIE